jgi:hypothetical protein
LGRRFLLGLGLGFQGSAGCLVLLALAALEAEVRLACDGAAPEYAPLRALNGARCFT